jgi:hypothetical protein
MSSSSRLDVRVALLMVACVAWTGCNASDSKVGIGGGGAGGGATASGGTGGPTNGGTNGTAGETTPSTGGVPGASGGNAGAAGETPSAAGGAGGPGGPGGQAGGAAGGRNGSTGLAGRSGLGGAGGAAAGNGGGVGSATAGHGGAAGGASGCALPSTVSFQRDVQPFLIKTCGSSGSDGCHVIDAASTMSSGGYDHAYDWITAGAHASSCPETPTPLRFQVVIAVIDQANPPSCSKSRQMPPPNATGGGLRAPLTACQVATLQSWLDEPLVTQMHRPDDSSPTTPYPMPPFN